MPKSLRYPPIAESSLRLFSGFLLWSVSATLTLVLLVSLGDGTILSKILLGVVAAALEGAKILSWRKGGRYRVYAVCLIILSGVASLGASLQVVERSRGVLSAVSREAARLSPAYLAQEAELRSIGSETAALVARLRSLPPDYTTAASRLESSLASLRDRQQTILASLAAYEPMGASQADGTIVVLLGRTVGLRPDVLLLVLLLFVSAAIEVGALLLTVPDREASSKVKKIERSPTCYNPTRETPKSVGTCLCPSYAPPITPEAFLEAAKDGADLPYIHGRDRTAEKVGISSAEAKRLVRKLISDGLVVVEGKRLRLCAVTDSVPSTPVTVPC